MDRKEFVEYWLNSSNDDYKVMNHLYASKDYNWCLFIGHLVIEKLLKALYVKNNNMLYPPKTHDLGALAEKAKLEMNDNIIKKLYIITSFNISARYSDYKNNFKKKCTKTFVDEQLSNIEEMRKWIIQKLI